MQKLRAEKCVFPCSCPQGVDMVHACYGMTSALLSSLDWVQSPHWDHRYSLVVGSDIALYPPGNEWKSARATGTQIE